MTRNDQNHSIGAFPADGWVRSTSCDPRGGNCVEINGAVSGRVGVRDSKRLHTAALVFGVDTWREFVRVARRGDFDY